MGREQPRLAVNGVQLATLASSPVEMEQHEGL